MFNPLLYLASLAAAAFAAPTPAVKRFQNGAALRNPADPVQAARIEAAAVKRVHRADKLTERTNQSWSRNYTHHKAFYAIEQGHISPLNLNPFYIAK